VSQYVERPPEAKSHPVVSQFIRSDIEKIVAMKPDLVIGFSDLQKEIASELIGRGVSVLVTNQRSLDEILNNILLISRLVGEEQKGLDLISNFKDKMDEIKRRSNNFKFKPKVYFEEWDHPKFSCIRWVSELIEVCGGVNIFSNKVGSLAKEREVHDEEITLRNPDLIFGCWCGKKVNLDSFLTRYPNINATQNKFIWELSPAIFLQPGPALFIDGLDQMFEKIETVVALTAKK
jgi:iron complex transport system substrate-binding protein